MYLSFSGKDLVADLEPPTVFCMFIKGSLDEGGIGAALVGSRWWTHWWHGRVQLGSSESFASRTFLHAFHFISCSR